MSYVTKDGKDTIMFVDKEYIESQAAEPVLEQDKGAATESDQAADQSAAFDPETGEINWDCPCLGGMAQGPCGEEFKAAFSCFVYSSAEPKGVDCVDKFRDMQDCFRRHPDVYGDEIDDDEEEDSKEAQEEGTSQDVEATTSESATSQATTAGQETSALQDEK